MSLEIKKRVDEMFKQTAIFGQFNAKMLLKEKPKIWATLEQKT